MSDPVFDPFDPKYRDNPYEHYQELRERAPVYRSESGYWVISSYEDIRNIQRTPELFSSSSVAQEMLGVGQAIDPSIPLAELGAQMPVDLRELMAAPVMVGTDEPKHTELRRVVNRAFLPNRIAQWDGQIAAYANSCLERITPGVSWDVVSTVATPLPVLTIGAILGIDAEQRPLLKDWSDIAIRAAFFDGRGTRESQLRTLTMLRDLSCFFGPLIEARRIRPGDDIISDLVRAEEQETLTAVETLMFIVLLMVAGTETTSNLIGTTVVCLLENPEQLEQVRKDPSLIPNAIEECLRYRSPAQFTIRSPRIDVEVRGKLIRAGELMCLMNASANRDPVHFPDPDRYDVTRSNKHHLAFGHGIHLCVGSHLSRREAATVVARLLNDLANWRLDHEPLRRLDSNAVFGYRRVALVPR